MYTYISVLIIFSFIVNCKLSEWGTWSKCSVTCGPNDHAGVRNRHRHIEVEAEHGGRKCDGRAMKQTEQCIHCVPPPNEKEDHEKTRRNSHKGECIPYCPSTHQYSNN